jgi:nitrogen-specific signal transduction histidine kinase
LENVVKSIFKLVFFTMKFADKSEIPIPDNISQRWQKTVNILASLIDVPVALIMRVDKPYIEVFSSSESANNPCKVGTRDRLAGLYCEGAIKKNDILLIPNALKDKEWDHNPDLELGLISYIGIPLVWPDNEIFGTLCVLDRKENSYSKASQDLLILFKELVESHLSLILKAYFDKETSQAALAEERETFYAILNKLPFSIRLQAKDYSIPWANKNFHEVFGNPENKFCYEIIQKREQPCTECTPFKIFDTPQTMTSEWVAPNGQTYLTTCNPFTGIDQTPFVLEVFIDITKNINAERELKKSEDFLLHADKLIAVGKLAASISHEVNNPLCGIRNVLNRLKNHSPMNEQSRQLIDLAFQECERIIDLNQKLKDFHRPTSGKFSNVNLHQLIDDVVLLFFKQFQKKQIKLSTDFDTDLGLVYVIEDQIKQVVLNIVQNAEEAIYKKNGKIQIRTRSADSHIKIDIQDTGTGIQADLIKNIFEPFYTTKSVKGTGLGLSVSHGIVNAHRGKIEVVSKPQTGSTFTIFLPKN